MIKRVSCCLLFFIMVQIKGELKKAQQFRSYWLANYHQFKQDWPTTQELYQQLFAQNSPHYVYKGYLYFLNDTEKEAQIIKLMPQLEKAFVDDVDVQLLFAQALAAQGDLNAADERFIALQQKTKTHQEIIFQAAQAYVRRKEPENAISAIDGLLNNAVRKPTHFVFHFLKAQIYVQLNNKESALASIKSSLELHPHFDKGWLLHAFLQEQMGNLQEAMRGYANFLTIAGSQKDIEQHLIQLAYKQKILEKQAPSQMRNAADCLENAMALFEQRRYKEALAMIERCRSAQGNAPDFKIFMVEVLTSLKRYDDALKELKNWILHDPEQPLFYTIAYMLRKTGIERGKIVAFFSDLEKILGDKTPLPALYLADLFLRAQDGRNALLYLQKSLDLVTDPDLQAAILFQRAMLYYKTKQYLLMEQDLLRGVALNNDFAPLLNLLAYYYATEKQKNQEAQELISRALSREPENPYFLDTQAIIWYNQQEYAKAAKLLMNVIMHEVDEPLIFEHLAHALFKTGDIDGARKSLATAHALTDDKEQRKHYNKLLHSWNK